MFAAFRTGEVDTLLSHTFPPLPIAVSSSPIHCRHLVRCSARLADSDDVSLYFWPKKRTKAQQQQHKKPQALNMPKIIFNESEQPATATTREKAAKTHV